ncbi:MAG: sugar nucleotide-binding protein [Bacteroidia bacterium]|nr:sugar nucleotide-binding protein [Bacteroidia bacterium]
MNNTRPILVLGSNGMLGQMVVSYFSGKGYSVIPVNTRFEEHTKWEFINSILKYPDAVVFNCVGRIKQKTNDEKDLLWSNTILPLTLARYLLPTQTIVHPSTDCVFNGEAGRPYTINDTTNARDSYGWSKILAEQALIKRPNTLIVRVSIIGPDKNPNARGLMGWFFSNAPGSKLNGYTNHLWNGITTLEWCKLAEKYINELHVRSEAVFVQPGTTEHYSKYDMLLLFQEIFATKFSISPFQTTDLVDRRLVPTSICKDLRTQLSDLHEFIQRKA